MSVQNEITRISGEVSNQAELIDQIQASLDNKADSTASSGEIPQTATPIEQNTARLQYVLDTVNTIPDSGHTHTVADITDLTATADELNYMDGVTSNVQTQLDGKLPKSGGDVSGHIYLTGAKESSSTSNTSQIVFGTSSNNHVAISSNNNALVINPTTTSTTNQIVLYLDKASQFKSGITTGSETGTLTGTASRAKKDGSGNVITSTYETKSDATEKYNAINERIDNIGSSAGGTGMLLVTLDDEGAASEIPETIVNHISNGGLAVLFDGDAFYSLSYTNQDLAIFSCGSEDPDVCGYWVYGDGSTEYFERRFATQDSIAGQLVVTYDEESDYANHNAVGIYEHIQSGGTAVLFFEDKYYNLSSCEEYQAVFSSVDVDTASAVAVFVLDDNTGGVVRFGGGTGGGAGVLIVTTDMSSASHDASEIYAHVQHGGTVVMSVPNGDYQDFYPLMYSNPYVAVFGFLSAEECWVYAVEVNEVGDVSSEYDWGIPNNEFVHSIDITTQQNWNEGVQANARANIGAASAKDVGDIDAALDAILAIQKELIGVTRITFTLDAEELIADEGMTWANWCDSAYNTRRICYRSGYVYDENGDKIVQTSSGGENDVLASDLVLAGGTYRVS